MMNFGRLKNIAPVRQALVGLGGMGATSRRRGAQAARSAYHSTNVGQRSAPPVSSAFSGGKVGMPSRTGGMTAQQRLAAARQARANAGGARAGAKRAAHQARDDVFYAAGKRRAAIGGGIVAGGAITANPRSNQSRTAPFGNGQRRAAGQSIQSPMGTGRYA